MDVARIAELLQPYLGPVNDQRLTTQDLRLISTYIDILVRWNARINLTAIGDPEEMVRRHFGESFFAARQLLPKGRVGTTATAAQPTRSPAVEVVRNLTVGAPRERGERGALPGRERSHGEQGALGHDANERRPPTDERSTVADVGSGAGFPGLPFKIWDPSISLTLIESNQKKAIFLREVVRALTLTYVDVQSVRAETLPPASFDLVTLRAVERFDLILSTAAALVKPTGRLALLIGAAQRPKAQSALPRYHWIDPVAIPASQSRILLVAQRLD